MIGLERRYYKEVDSTNIKAKAWAKEGARAGSLVIADKQTMGKGRNGRAWSSPAGVGIWMSILLRPTLPPAAIPQLALVAGLAACKVIQEETGLDAKIKWPNDVVVNGKKVCGVLCEMQASALHVNYAVVGIGINVNTEQFPDTLPYASSLYLESGSRQDREKLINRFCTCFNTYYELYEQEATLRLMLQEYKDNCITLNNMVKIIDMNQSYEAYATTINKEGHLIVTRGDGTTQSIFVGEVSVRGLYGYIE